MYTEKTLMDVITMYWRVRILREACAVGKVIVVNGNCNKAANKA